MGPHPDVGQVPIFTAERIGKHDARSGAVNVVGVTVVTGVLNGIGRHRNRPKLTGVNLGKCARGLPPAAPVKFCVGNKRSDFCVREAFCVLARPTFFPKMVDGAWPTAFGKRANADLRVQNVLPEGIDVVGIGHQRPQSNDCNWLKGTLLNPLARFAICCGQ